MTLLDVAYTDLVANSLLLDVPKIPSFGREEYMYLSR